MSNDEMKREIDQAAKELTRVLENLNTEDSRNKMHEYLDELIMNGQGGAQLALLVHLITLSQDMTAKIGMKVPQEVLLMTLIAQVGPEVIMEALNSSLTHSVFRLREYADKTGQLEALKYSLTRQAIEEYHAIKRAEIRKQKENGNN